MPGSISTEALTAETRDAIDQPSPRKPSRTSRVVAHLRSNVDPQRSVWPLAGFCFMTGFTDAVTYTTAFVWAAFQTGNTIQLSLALGRLVSPSGQEPRFQPSDGQAICSLLSFLLGSALGHFANLETILTNGDAKAPPSWRNSFGPKRRAWLILGTLLTSLLTMAAALCAWASAKETGRGGLRLSNVPTYLVLTNSEFVDTLPISKDAPLWGDATGFVVVGFLSCSMGLQAVMATGIDSAFATSVVLTGIWVQLVSDPVWLAPKLEAFWPLTKTTSKPRPTSPLLSSTSPAPSSPTLIQTAPLPALPSRALAIFALFVGGFVGRVLLGSSLGVAGTIGIGAGLRLVVAALWIL
ncbi:hypothetical protein BKA62DRAFT_512954 [Auriculariales sp. MPI-PUGE-AT-0066]|nr:hypothetical protein BKA62DRAFT_512954 [Auriculariales sp. MPI-PUGE-AT-0066]